MSRKIIFLCRLHEALELNGKDLMLTLSVLSILLLMLLLHQDRKDLTWCKYRKTERKRGQRFNVIPANRNQGHYNVLLELSKITNNDLKPLNKSTLRNLTLGKNISASKSVNEFSSRRTKLRMKTAYVLMYRSIKWPKAERRNGLRLLKVLKVDRSMRK